jgi:alkylation response protein AidB-like acyl-CoA dehydrogenase
VASRPPISLGSLATGRAPGALLCVVDECVQLHGGRGYMLDYPVARAFIDNRASRIDDGTHGIMKQRIARTP